MTNPIIRGPCDEQTRDLSDGVPRALGSLRLDQAVEELNHLALYGKNRVHPGCDPDVREAVQKFSQTIVAAHSPAGGRLARLPLCEEARGLLLNFASDGARMAVEERSPAWVAGGLLAIAIEAGELDPESSIRRLRELRRSAIELGLEVETLFRHAAQWTSSAELANTMEEMAGDQVDDEGLHEFSRLEAERAHGCDTCHEPEPSLPRKRDKWGEKVRKLFG